jgi:hypothetical protein
LIVPDTPEWSAWWDYYDSRRNELGKSFGQSRMRQARAAGLSYHEAAQWPPGYAMRDQPIAPLIVAADQLATRAAERIASAREPKDGEAA